MKKRKSGSEEIYGGYWKEQFPITRVEAIKWQVMERYTTPNENIISAHGCTGQRNRTLSLDQRRQKHGVRRLEYF